jgi:hypothetical protein
MAPAAQTPSGNGRWIRPGPVLPIEFARVSEDGRLTLVIHPGSPPQQTYWAQSGFDEVQAARRNLKDREGCSLAAIHHFPPNDAGRLLPSAVTAALESWLPKNTDIHAAVWTGLTTNWCEKFQRDFSPDEAVRYLEGLEAERKQASATYKRAKEYVQNAPSSIQTEVRTRMREKGWADAKLSNLLFETPREG